MRVSKGGASLEDRADVPLPAPADLVGAPIAFRGTASSRIPLRPVADFLFRRNERVRIEWPALKALDQRTARVLDRKGQRLALSVTVTETPVSDQSATTLIDTDLNLAPLAEGDYLIELTAGVGGRIARRRTGNSPRGASADSTYVGLEGGLTLLTVRFSAGVTHQVAGLERPNAKVFTWSVGVQTGW